MKNRIIVLATIILFLATAPGVFAQLIDQPVARVRLTRVEVITQRQLRRQVELIERQATSAMNLEGRKRVLDMQVGDVLLTQAAARDNVRVTDLDVQASIEQHRRSLGAQVSEAQFRLLIQDQLGSTYEEFVANVRKRLTQEKFVMEEKRNVLASVGEPTADEIQEAYYANATDFTNPLMIRYSHVFVETRNLSEGDKRLARVRAEEALRLARSPANGFKEAVEKFSDDTGSRYRGGDAGYLPRNDSQRQMLLGRTFFDAVFDLRPNQVSGIIESNVGYHIVMVTERRDPRLLGLDDPLAPGSPISVRERIRTILRARSQQAVFQRALNEVLEELKKEAEITIFEQALNW